MFLKKISIENFKGVHEPVEINFDKFNMIIGKNDAGKSTILKALDCLLNKSNPKLEDKNIRSESSTVKIVGFFEAKSTSILIDGTVSTTMEDEELIDENGHLVIKREWDLNKAQVKADTFIVRKKYEQDFMAATEAALIKICKDNSIDTRKGNNEDFNNVEKRQKLREFFNHNGQSFEFAFEKLPTSGTTRFKEIGAEIEKILPRFEYFKADSSLSESDTAIQNFFKKLAEQTISSEIDTHDLEEKIAQKISTVLSKITSKINSVVGDDEAVEPEITFDWAKLIQTSFTSKNQEGDIPLRSRGDGFRRITMMAYFEHLAETSNENREKIIFGFEEPETFLHPSAQEKLFEKLEKLSSNGCITNCRLG